VLARHLGDYSLSRSLGEASLATAREVDDRRAVADALEGLGWIEQDQGRLREADGLLAECAEIRRELGDRNGAAIILRLLGYGKVIQGDYAAARVLLDEAKAQALEVRDRRTLAVIASTSSILRRIQGDLDGALREQEQELAIGRDLRDRVVRAMALDNLGDLALLQGDHATARAYYREALTALLEIGERRRLGMVLRCAAGLAVAEGAVELGLRVSLAAGRIADGLGVVVAPVFVEQYAHQDETAWAALGEARARAVEAVARTLTLEQAAAEMAAWLDSNPGPSIVEGKPTVGTPADATPIVERPSDDATATDRGAAERAAHPASGAAPASLTGRQREVAALSRPPRPVHFG